LHKRQGVLGLQASPVVSSEEVEKLCATVADLRPRCRRGKRMPVSEHLATSTTRISALEGELRAANSFLEVTAAKMTNLEAFLESAQKRLESVREEEKLASDARLNPAMQISADTESLREIAEGTSRALTELQLLPNPISVDPVLEIALWYADVLKQLETLPKKLRQKLEAKGKCIVKIVGVTILPRVHHLAPSFRFQRLFESFGKHKEGKAAQQSARSAIAHVFADLKRRVIRALPKA
jgi:hypothetical protein